MNHSSFHNNNDDDASSRNNELHEADMRGEAKKAALTLDFSGTGSSRNKFYFNGPPTATPFLDSTDIHKFVMSTPDVENFLNQTTSMEQLDERTEMRVKSEQETRLSPVDDVGQDMKALHVDPGTRVSPIDMNDQEAIKLERKRLRNRIAASKCRKRKLEKIARLEDKVRKIKGENSDLSIAILKLKDYVMSLKKDLIEHVNAGCDINMSF